MGFHPGSSEGQPGTFLRVVDEKTAQNTSTSWLELTQPDTLILTFIMRRSRSA